MAPKAKSEVASPSKPSPKPTSTIPDDATSRPLVPVISGLLMHSVAMMFVPWFLFYFTVSGSFDPLFAVTFGVPDTKSKGTIAAILAVIGVNVVVGNFVLRAFKEDDAKDTKAKKKTD